MTKPLSPEDREHVGLDRRTMLRGVAVTGALGASASLLAACGGDDSGGSASPDAGGSGSSDGGGGSASLGAASAIPVGGGMVFKDQKIVVTQPSKGDFQAFTAVCTHQGCIVAEVSEGTINCACHGSMYSIEDGAVVGGPAPQPLAERQIDVQGGQISLA